MDIYRKPEIRELLEGNPYVGRGIITGTSPSGMAVSAYFIMGRSANSRNRVFTVKGGDVFTEPFDASKVTDPSLIIYAAVRTLKDRLVVTNGDQTDTVAEGYAGGKSFSESLASRCFEPDGPNWTPRISSVTEFSDGGFSYSMSILKSIDAEGSGCARFTFDYPSVKGLGHFIHTYVTDGSPIPTFQGEPERVSVPEDIGAFTDEIWKWLDADNRISLYVRYTDPATGKYESRLVNKNC